MENLKNHLLTTLVLCFLLISNSLVAKSAEQPTIIPLPNNITLREGNFKVLPSTKIIYADNSLADIATSIQSSFKDEFNLVVVVERGKKPKKGSIFLHKASGFNTEAYTLDIQSQSIVCTASDDAGIFYASQSLLQLLEKDEPHIPTMLIEDQPTQAWRGFMLDEARHFFGKEAVIQYLDIMARLKLNRFHWHLTDEQAWRIEIKRYPKLTEIGSTGSWSDSKAPSQFYTQEDIKEIVAHAAKLYIEVIPEIDMPGHATAVSRAYPEISGGGTGKWNGFTFHPTKDYTYEFIENIFDEVAELFPFRHIHIGGDEVHFGNQSWFTDPIIQKFIQDNDLKNEVGLEHYFVRRVTNLLTKKGIVMIGWDEILNAGVTPNQSIVMWWRHDKPELLTEALNKGFKVITTPRIPCYFDFVQHSSHQIGRLWDKGYNNLATVYNFSKDIKEIIGDNKNLVLGLQANAWSERITNKTRLDYMVFPRLLAIAENGWTEESKKDYNSFELRVKLFMKYLDKHGVKYFNVFDKDATPEPWGPMTEDPIANG